MKIKNQLKSSSSHTTPLSRLLSHHNQAIQETSIDLQGRKDIHDRIEPSYSR